MRYHSELKYRQAGQSEHPGREFGLIGTSQTLRTAIQQARQAARVSDAPVIITGESGTGKQLIAEMIHRLDNKRSQRPFVSVNCAAITGTLAESALFGHVKGAFTGATDDRPGYFRAAQGGTIMLDEIGELSGELQPKALRLLQEGLVMPVGSDREYEVDVRVIGATNRDLAQMVEQGQFRLDLFQRLNVIHLSLPSLRQRSEDIPLLFESFLEKYAHYYPGRIEQVDAGVYEVLARSVGQGNIRELENIVRQVLVFKEGGSRIGMADLPRTVIEGSLASEMPTVGRLPDEAAEQVWAGRKDLCQAVDEYERLILQRLISRGASRSDIAQRLGVTRRTLYNKLQKHGLC